MVRYPVREPFVANTDWAWFEHLSSMQWAGRHVDEVNFWLPKAVRSMKAFVPGCPVFFRLKAPRHVVVGYGFFAAFHLVDLQTCWELFEWKNGDPDRERFLRRIGSYRGVDLLDARVTPAPIGCTILRDPVFWPPERWLPWGTSEGWPMNVVQGKTERDEARVAILMAAIREDQRATPAEFDDRYGLTSVDERRLAFAERVVREGQGAFRLRLLTAYAGRCAITGEHTEPVLDAAHIQPYQGPRSNHVQNGLVLTKEFHALFDRGYVAITPDYRVLVSPRLQNEWGNGHRYYPFDGKPLKMVPDRMADRPSPDALDWHYRIKFLRTG